MSDAWKRYSPRRQGVIFEVVATINAKHLVESGLPHAAGRALDTGFGAASDHANPENP